MSLAGTGPSAPQRTLAALQRALAAEHAAIWGYGVVGAHLPGTLADQARSADGAHRARRDALSALIRDRGGTPQGAAASYQLPAPITGASSALRLAIHLEEGVAAAWHDALGATADTGLRRTALGALADAAVRATRWRMLADPASPATVPFPGT